MQSENQRKVMIDDDLLSGENVNNDCTNPKYDKLYDKALLCNDLQERAQYYTEMDSLIMQDAPVVVLFYDEVLRFVNKRVHNMGSNPTNLLDLRRVRIDAKKSL